MSMRDEQNEVIINPNHRLNQKIEFGIQSDKLRIELTSKKLLDIRLLA